MGYKWRTRPFKHQIEAIKKAIKLGNIALLMAPRTGKSKTTIDYISWLAQFKGVTKAFIVCPNRIMDVWVDEIHTHCPLKVHITVWDRAAREDKKPIPEASGVFDLHIVITNYETFSVPGKKIMKSRKVCDKWLPASGLKGSTEHTEVDDTGKCKDGHATGKTGLVWNGNRSVTTGRFKHRNLVKKWVGQDRCVGVLDEFHKLQDPSGKWSVMLVSMRDLFYKRVGLTGTPIPKASKIHALYMLWQWINPDRFEDVAPTVADFKNLTGTWVAKQNYGMWVGPKDSGVTLVHERIHEDAFAVRIEDCFDMPPILPDRIMNIKLTKSAKAYDDMATQMFHMLETGDIVEAPIALVQGLRLAQLTGGLATVPDMAATVLPGAKRPSKLIKLGTEKLKALKEILVEEMMEQEQKVIIAARFKGDLTRIANLCKSIGMDYYQLRGGMSRRDGTLAWKNFNQSNSPCAFIMQPAAGGMGIDLSTAPHFIWYSLTPSFIDFTQANQRNAKSPCSVSFTYLLVPNSIDTLMYDALNDDGDVAKRMMTRPHELLRRGK